MKQTRWLRVRTVPVTLALLAAVWVAGGSTCINNGLNQTPTGSVGTPVPEIPATPQPGSADAPNTPPVVTFQWPTAPVSIQTGTVVTIQWTLKDPEDNATVSILARDSFGADIVLVQAQTGTHPQSTGSFLWNTSNVPVGAYSIVAIAKDGKAAPQQSVAPGIVTIIPRPADPVDPTQPVSPVPNSAPTISISAPAFNVTINQGDTFNVIITTQDRDEAVQLTAWVDPDTIDNNGNEIQLTNQLIPYNGSTQNSVTTTIPWVAAVSAGVYRVAAQVDDRTGINSHIVKAVAPGTITVMPQGTGQMNHPPTVVPALPSTDAGLSDRDLLDVCYQVTDSDADPFTLGNANDLQVTIYFDRDTNPTNDATDPPLLVGQRSIPANSFFAGQLFAACDTITIDTVTMPVREETDEAGRPLPYFIRVRVDDGQGGVVDGYATGKVRILGSAVGVVDLLSLGTSITGATVQGFNGDPFSSGRGSRAGSAMTGMGDIDGDGNADFAIAAETATPFNRDNVGMAYLIYGRARNASIFNFNLGRYAGVLSLNSVGTFIPFPPNDPNYQQIYAIRGTQLFHPPVSPPGSSLGISSLASWADITGDLTPELLIGCKRESNVADNVDQDPCDFCQFTSPPSPKFICYTNLMHTTANSPLSGNIIFAPGGTGQVNINANAWAPAAPPPGTASANPNVIVTDIRPTSTAGGKRLLQVDPTLGLKSGFAINLSGTLRGVMPTGNPAVCPVTSFTIDVQIETAEGPMRTAVTMSVDPSSCSFPDPATPDPRIYIPVNNPNFPVTVGSATPPATLPPSVYDGAFSVFIRPSRDIQIQQATVEIHGWTGDTEEHLYAAQYFDGYPDEVLTNGCNSSPADIYVRGALALSPARPLNDTGGAPALFEHNDDRFSASGISGYACGNPLVAGISNPSNGAKGTNDHLFDGGLYNTAYASGIVYLACSDSLLLPPFGSTGGRRTAEIGDFGQTALIGARFRGAWFQSDAPPVGPVYDPPGLFGTTVDTMPDINDSPGGLNELIISAPGSGRSTTGTADLSAALLGTYSPGQSQQSDFKLLDATGQPLSNKFTAFSSVQAASLQVWGMTLNTGVVTPPAKLTAALIRVMPPATLAVSDMVLWNGDANFNGDYEFPEFYHSPFVFNAPPFAPPLTFSFPTSQLGGFVQAGTDASPTGNNNFRIVLFLNPDPTVVGSRVQVLRPSPGPAVTLSVTGLAPNHGMITVLDGADYSARDANGIASWPRFECGGGMTTGNPPTRGGTIAQLQPGPVTTIWGEQPLDMFGWARNADDINDDRIADIACGSPGNDNDPIDLINNANKLNNNGKAFIVFGTRVLGNGVIGPPFERTEIRGTHNGDQFGRVQGSAGDFNGDGRKDAYFGAGSYDFTSNPMFAISMNDVITGAPLPTTDPLTGAPLCDAGYAAVLFGSSILTGEHILRAEQVGTGNFLGVKFVGGFTGARLGGGTPPPGSENNPAAYAGSGVSSAGDFNKDGVDDLLITAPGQRWPGARIIFHGPVTDGQTISINGTVFEFDTDADPGSVGAGRKRVNVSGTNGNTALKAEAAMRAAMAKAGQETLSVSGVLSRTIFPSNQPPNLADPTTVFLARQAGAFSVTTSAPVSTIEIQTYVRQGVTYLVYGATGTALVNKTFRLPQDLNRRDTNGNRVLKGIVFVSPYEIPGGQQHLSFETQSACLLDPSPVDNLSNCSAPNCGNLIRFSNSMWPPVAGVTPPRSSPNMALEMGPGTHTITFPAGPASAFSCFFTRTAAATTAHIEAFDGQGVLLASGDAATMLPLAPNFNAASTSCIDRIVITVAGAGGKAAIDDIDFISYKAAAAPVESVAAIGDTDGDGFPDIILGSPQADFINALEPCNRRRSAGEAYVIYGNSFGANAAGAP